MTNERVIDRWIYPMDSSSTPYNDPDFSPEVVRLCQEETDVLNDSDRNITQHQQRPGLEQQSSALLLKSKHEQQRKSEPIRNRLRIAKCNVVGDPSVGKTCLINRFGYDVFDSDSKATIGVDFDVQKFSILQRPFTLQIWDTAGDERFRSITRTYYRGAHATMIVFDMSAIKSFQNVQNWYDEIMDATKDSSGGANPEMLDDYYRKKSRQFLFLIGAKKDLITEETVQFYRQEGAKLAERIGAEFWMVSSTTGENVNDLFNRVACLCFNKYLYKELCQQQQEQQIEASISFPSKVPNIDQQQQQQPQNQNNRKRSVHYSRQNGGEISFQNEEEVQKSKYKSKENRPALTNTVWSCLVDWWSQWFGHHGEIRKRVRRMANGNKVSTGSSNSNREHAVTNDGIAASSPKKKRNTTCQCFRFTCMVSVD